MHAPASLSHTCADPQAAHHSGKRAHAGRQPGIYCSIPHMFVLVQDSLLLTPTCMQIHWLRIVLDEGHMLGASLALTNKLAMSCALTAERRWVMTGTPAPAGGSAPLAHLQPLLAFLGHVGPSGRAGSLHEDHDAIIARAVWDFGIVQLGSWTGGCLAAMLR